MIIQKITVRNDLGGYFELKEESIGPPKIYKGGTVQRPNLTIAPKFRPLVPHNTCIWWSIIWSNILAVKINRNCLVRQRLQYTQYTVLS